MAYIPGRKEHKKKIRGAKEDVAESAKAQRAEAEPFDLDLLKLKKAYEELESTHL